MTFTTIGETVEIVHRTTGGRDADGNAVPSTSTTPAPNAVYVPGTSTENVQGQDLVVISDRFVWVDPPFPTIASTDAIQRQNGDLYEVTGNPNLYTSPFSGTQALAVNVRKVTG